MIGLLTIVSGFCVVFSESSDKCSTPLGMESGSILDSQLSASSSYASSVGPAMGRLHGVNGGGAWCPSDQVGGQREEDEWLEVNLGRVVLLTGVSLQGRWDNGNGQEFTPLVRIVTDDFESDSHDWDGFVWECICTGTKKYVLKS